MHKIYNNLYSYCSIAYTMAKYGMSLCVLGMAKEFEEDGIAVNALWPRTGTLHHNKVMFNMIIY